MTRSEETDMQTKRRWKKSVFVPNATNQPIHYHPPLSGQMNKEKASSVYLPSRAKVDMIIDESEMHEKKRKEKRVTTINVQ